MQDGLSLPFLIRTRALPRRVKQEMVSGLKEEQGAALGEWLQPSKRLHPLRTQSIQELRQSSGVEQGKQGVLAGAFRFAQSVAKFASTMHFLSTFSHALGLPLLILGINRSG